MGPVKVKIKLKSDSLVCNKKNLQILLHELDIKIKSFIFKTTEIIVTCVDVDEAEKVFSDTSLAALSSSDFSPILPPELRCSRSVILHNVDSEILSNDTQSIKTEIERCNSWCKIIEVIKFRNGRGMKIVFTSSSMSVKSRKKSIYWHQKVH